MDHQRDQDGGPGDGNVEEDMVVNLNDHRDGPQTTIEITTVSSLEEG